MIGYSSGQNDIYWFFEGSDLEELNRTRKVTGSYITPSSSSVGKLEISIGITREERIEARGVKDDNENVIGMEGIISPRVWESFLERRQFEDHQGFRHISLIDASKQCDIPFHLQQGYQFAKASESKK